MCYRLTDAAVLWQIFVTSMAVNWCVWILVCPRQWIIFLLFFHIPALKLKLKYPAGNSHAVWFSSHTCCAIPGQTAEQKAKDLPATYLILTRIQPLSFRHSVFWKSSRKNSEVCHNCCSSQSLLGHCCSPVLFFYRNLSPVPVRRPQCQVISQFFCCGFSNLFSNSRLPANSCLSAPWVQIALNHDIEDYNMIINQALPLWTLDIMTILKKCSMNSSNLAVSIFPHHFISTR